MRAYGISGTRDKNFCSSGIAGALVGPRTPDDDVINERMGELGPGDLCRDAGAALSPQPWSFCTMSTRASGWPLPLTRPLDSIPRGNGHASNPDSPAGARSD